MPGSRTKPWIVDDELWGLIEPLLPQTPRRFRYPGRRPLDDRLVLHGILFVLHTGIGLRAPAPGTRVRLGDDRLAPPACVAGRRGLGSPAPGLIGAPAGSRSHRLVTRDRRFLIRPGQKVGSWLGPSPVDRGRAGVKHHVLTDARGLRLAWSATAANRNDLTQLIPLVEAIPHVHGPTGRPRHRPGRVIADRGDDHDSHRRQPRARGIAHAIAHRGTEHGSGLGRHRWVVERTISHLHNKRRLVGVHRPDQGHPRRPAQPGCVSAVRLPVPAVIVLELLSRRAGRGPAVARAHGDVVRG